MDQKIVHEFSRLRVLSNRKSDPPSPSRTKKKLVSTGTSSAASKNMDALVHDLNTALELDEANNRYVKLLVQNLNTRWRTPIIRSIGSFLLT